MQNEYIPEPQVERSWNISGCQNQRNSTYDGRNTADCSLSCMHQTWWRWSRSIFNRDWIGWIAYYPFSKKAPDFHTRWATIILLSLVWSSSLATSQRHPQVSNYYRDLSIGQFGMKRNSCWIWTSKSGELKVLVLVALSSLEWVFLMHVAGCKTYPLSQANGWCQLTAYRFVRWKASSYWSPW